MGSKTIQLKKARNIVEEYSMVNTLKGEKLPTITQNVVHKICKADKKRYKKLPQEITIYRGCHKDEYSNPTGQSWTLSKDTARHFAWLYYTADEKFTFDDMKDRVLLKATISKKDVFAFLQDIRYEEECIVNPSGLKNIEIVEGYEFSNLEAYFNKFLIKKTKYSFRDGIKGTVGIKNFRREVVSIDIEKFLSLAEEDSILSFLN